MSSADPDRAEDAGEAVAGEEEDTGAQFKPIVKLEEVAVTTGEEEEDVLLDLKAKLYRFDKDGNQWKERGTGSVKLLKHKGTGKVRLVMRQAKTLKICANHLVLRSLRMQEHAGSDKSCVWHATDFSDGELKDEMFCIRFGSVENCKKFMERVEEVAESIGNDEDRENEDATSASELLLKLSVSEEASKAGEENSKKSKSEEPSSKAEEENSKTETKSKEPSSKAEEENSKTETI